MRINDVLVSAGSLYEGDKVAHHWKSPRMLTSNSSSDTINALSISLRLEALEIQGWLDKIVEIVCAIISTAAAAVMCWLQRRYDII